MIQEGTHANALIGETSPYLLQHARNPVDWMPWSPAAMERAREEDKPIFLSIGYSTCHWCHVMERESFEDEEVAALLNRCFVSVKVDREERPDVDAVYMEVCQAMTGGGGWPLTILMTPEQKPFLAGTYFPKRRKYGQAGLMELLSRVADMWAADRAALLEAAQAVTDAVAGREEQTSDVAAGDRSLARRAARQLASAFDSRYGGFGRAPKFPMPHNLMFLLRFYAAEEDAAALAMVEATLEAMYRGGIFDHIGFGFSRYSTDERWLAPHFEKMLYDNALLVISLIECYQATGKSLYRTIAERVLAYARREMTAPEGGFYSAQDADSDGVEGKYYTFTPDEVIAVLGEAAGREFCGRYDITGAGNFEGRSIPNLLKAGALIEPPEEQASRDKLYAYRLARTRLHKDDKILAAWNGLMITAYAKAYAATGEEAYLAAAEKAYAFARSALWTAEGLKSSWREGKVSGPGLLDDYAYMLWASLALYEATLKTDYLSAADALAREALARFGDAEGGCFLSPADGERLLFRPKETYDGALPSGNSVLAYCLGRLAAITGDTYWMEESDRQLAALLPAIDRHPQGHTFGLMAWMEKLYPSRHLVCLLSGEGGAEPSPGGRAARAEASRPHAADKRLAILALSKGFYPDLTVVYKAPDDEELARLCPYLKDYALPSGKSSTFHLCEGQRCAAPVDTLEDALRMLARDNAIARG